MQGTPIERDDGLAVRRADGPVWGPAGLHEVWETSGDGTRFIDPLTECCVCAGIQWRGPGQWPYCSDWRHARCILHRIIDGIELGMPQLDAEPADTPSNWADLRIAIAIFVLVLAIGAALMLPFFLERY